MAPWPNSIRKAGWLLTFYLSLWFDEEVGFTDDDFWCCQGTLIQAHSVYANHIFYEEGENLVLSQYIPCQLDWNRNGTSVGLTLSEDQHLDAHRRPCSQSYELKITCAQPQEFTIKFRLPWWINANPEVFVNGEKQAVAGNPSTYASIRKIWHNNTLQIPCLKVSA